MKDLTPRAPASPCTLQGKTVVITGASSGLGAALALCCARQHARLFLAAPDASALEAVAERCREAGASTATVLPTDVTQPDDCARLIARAAGETHGIDYLVLNAGISMWARFEDIEDLGLFKRLMEVNYLGAVYCTRHALPHLRATKGLIVAVSSIQGRVGIPLHTGYSASKHALEGFLGALRHELEGSGVDILTVLPHWLSGTGLRASALGPQGAPMGDAKRSHSREAVPVETAAEIIAGAMLARRKELVIPAKLRALFLVNALCPRLAAWIIKWKMAQQQ